MGYVTAFRGRRDSYQVPLALAESGQLDCFITDYYCGYPEPLMAHLLPARLAESLRSRRTEGLPEKFVTELTLTAAIETAARILKIPPAWIYETFDRRFGDAAARKARQLNSDLLMYSSYASDAFDSQFSHMPRKILFQYHPHYELETAILAADRQLCQKFDIVFRGELESLANVTSGSRERGDSAWKVADETICASSFTKNSLIHAGADPKSITVIPYGVDFPMTVAPEPNLAGNGFHALFVGSGLQRKGLHHLLLAWQRAQLGAEARLTIVSRVVDPGLKTLLHSTPGVRLKLGVNADELLALYRDATVFVMPSLVEGFGQVYLEALAQGLPVVGTPYTCLPDIGDEADGIFLSTAGNLDELVALLERLSVDLIGNTAIRARAAGCAKQFSWAAFRAKLISVL